MWAAFRLLQSSWGSLQGVFPCKSSPPHRTFLQESHRCCCCPALHACGSACTQRAPSSTLHTLLKKPNSQYQREADGWKSIQDLLGRGMVQHDKQALTVPPSLPRNTQSWFGTGPGQRATVLRCSHAAGCAPSRSAQPRAVGLRLQLVELGSSGHSHQHSLSGHSPMVRDPFPCCCPACTAWQRDLTLTLTPTQPQPPREQQGMAGWGAQEPGCGMLADLRGCL